MSDSYKQFKMYSKDQVKRGASDKKYGTLCLKKNVPSLTGCRFNTHPPLFIIFGTSSADIEQKAQLSQRGRAMLRASIASIQNIEHSLLLLVVSVSNIYHCVQLNSFLFSSAYLSMLQAVTNKNIRWCVANCAIYTAWSSVTVFVTS